ncbi:hypothetical protein [Kribbella sp. DT2]|uniref:hypothetical protein n=1 Tax=Kribbella sp. DT2 TaxID=3393427 RepID=UPI003CEE9D3F
MNTPRRFSPSRAGRFLMILGAFLGVFAMHSLSPVNVSVAEITSVSVPQNVASSAAAHAVAEGLEKIAVTAPSVLPGAAGGHHVLPCVAFLAGSLLLLAGLTLRRQRIGDDVRRLGTTGLSPTRLRICPAAPQLTKLCVLRT